MAGRLKNLAKSLAAPFGVTGYNYYLFRTLKRPEWIYRARGKIPFRKLTFPPPAEIAPADITLCGRLITAYRKASENDSDSQDQSALWSQITRHHRQRLIDALNQADPAPLATVLNTMFREEFLYGIASGHLYADSKTWIGSRIWSLKCLDDLVSLAESLGVVRAECPEQGVLGYSFRDGLESLVGKIESSMGIPIGFPDVGAPYGIQIGQTLITMESPEHLYAACRVNDAIKTILEPSARARPRIVEIGGGFGGTAYWLLKLRRLGVSSYTIIDLPLTNVLQGYFLSKSLGEAEVVLYGEDNPGAKPLRVLPASALDALDGAGTNVLINQNSMPEIPERAVAQYLQWAKRNLRGIFYSYNQEAYSPVGGIPQVLVPEAITQVGGFHRLSRQQSWLRRGYVEEIYASHEDSIEATSGS